MLRPRGCLCLVEMEDPKETKTKSGLVIPEAVAHKSPTRYGIVTVIGEGKILDSGVFCPITGIRVGDRVLFQIGNAVALDEKGGPKDGRQLFLLNDQDILAVDDPTIEPSKEN